MRVQQFFYGTFTTAALFAVGPLFAQEAQLRFPVSAFGTPGIIDMPSGEVFADGTVQTSFAYHAGTQKYNLSFQVTPRIFGSFRYSIIDDYDGPNQKNGGRFDRSFDFGYLIAPETLSRPSIAFGLRDFGGTGVYGAEYLAATKHFMDDRLVVTGGIGWGRLGTFGGFDNPLGQLSDHFNARSEGAGVGGDTGQLDFDQWFRGDAALFGGLAYQITPRLAVKAEYSSDAYVVESKNAGFVHNSPINIALSYGFNNGSELSVYALHGSEVGIMGSFAISPQNPRIPGGLDSAPPVLMPRQTAAALSWNPAHAETNNATLAAAFEEQGLSLEGITVNGSVATIRMRNNQYSAQAQALGRAARLLANHLPEDVSSFRLESTANGMTTSRTTLRRGDLEELEYDLDGSWRIYARAEIEDAPQSEADTVTGAFPKIAWSIGPYVEPSFFDPDSPVRLDVGVQASATVELSRGLYFSGLVRQPITGNVADSTRPSNSVLPHVRTDALRYATESDFEIKRLTTEYFFRPSDNVYARVSAGIFETMYGGVSGEVLWRPINSSLALGAELNYAKKRNFDQLLGFQDYEIMTGHASAYYDFGNGYLGQVDVGRYLAGDYGATISLDREFNNGFRVGAYFTLTDVPFDEFGEGSFDKGVRIWIPIGWLSGASGNNGYGTSISPITRDGGARLDVPNRLYDLTRGSQTNEIEDQWGRFWR